MSDRLALTEAIEAGGIERAKATRIASVIFDAIHQNVATKADVQAEVASLRSEITGGFASLRADMADRFGALQADIETRFARQDIAIERLRSSVRETENRLLVRLGGWIVALLGLLFAALHLWPPR